MNALHYNTIGYAFVLGVAMFVPAGSLRADDLKSRLTDRSAADGELVPPQVPAAPNSADAVYDSSGHQNQTVYRPVYVGRRYYRGPVYGGYRGWGPRYYAPYRAYYYQDYGDAYFGYYGGPRYGRYYGTPRFGYYDYPYGGSARVGPLRFYWR